MEYDSPLPHTYAASGGLHSGRTPARSGGHPRPLASESSKLFSHFAEVNDAAHTAIGADALSHGDREVEQAARDARGDAALMGTLSAPDVPAAALAAILRDAPREQHEHIIRTFREGSIARGTLNGEALDSAVWRAKVATASPEWRKAVQYHHKHPDLHTEFNALTLQSCVAGIGMGTADPDLVREWQEDFNKFKILELKEVYGMDAKPVQVDGRIGPGTVQAARLLAEAEKRSNRPDV